MLSKHVKGKRQHVVSVIRSFSLVKFKKIIQTIMADGVLLDFYGDSSEF